MENLEQEEILKLLKENLKISQEILRQSRKVQRYIFWQRILSWFYFVLIVGPLILALIYLPPLLKDVVGKYQDVFQQLETGQTLNPNQLKQIVPSGINLDELLRGVK